MQNYQMGQKTSSLSNNRVVELRLNFPCVPFNIIHRIIIESLLDARQVLGTGNTGVKKKKKIQTVWIKGECS